MSCVCVLVGRPLGATRVGSSEASDVYKRAVQEEILNLLMDLQESVNLTYLRVFNDLGVVGHMCKRISVMNKGE